MDQAMSLILQSPGSKSTVFNPARFDIARKRKMLSKKDVAELIGVTQQTIVRWEKSAVEPLPENIDALERILGFPKEFFFGAKAEEPQNASFRNQTAMTARARDAALAAGAIGFMLSDWVDERFNLPAISVPNLSGYEPEFAARTLRQEWSLGEKPISNMIHLLEAKGVRIFSLAENTLKINAYTIWSDGKPFVFLNTIKSAESSRFDAAHELGHLVLHQDGGFSGRDAEDQANRFASEFLMPKSDVLANKPVLRNVQDLLKYKRRWKVSAVALAYRLHKLGVLSDWKYRDYCIEMSKMGYNKNEPETIDREKSIVWEKILRSLWHEKVTLLGLCNMLHIPEQEVIGLIFGLHSKVNFEQQGSTNLRVV
jgi:Zn-dependent peptidase ImmA (M78 family)/transcriptional regulator with XRE-family HTH domain